MTSSPAFPNQDSAHLNVADGHPLELLASRRSNLAVQLIEPGPSDEELQRILAIAVRVPDHGRMTPWRLQMVAKPAQAELGELFVKEFLKTETDAKPDRLELERMRPQRSPVLVVVSSRTTHGNDNVPPVEQLLSGGNVCFNLLNAAVASGYGAQWVTNWPAYNATIKAALDIPEDEYLIGFIHIGSRKTEPQERQRPELTDVVSTVQSLLKAG